MHDYDVMLFCFAITYLLYLFICLIADKKLRNTFSLLKLVSRSILSLLFVWKINSSGLSYLDINEIDI